MFSLRMKVKLSKRLIKIIYGNYFFSIGSFIYDKTLSSYAPLSNRIFNALLPRGYSGKTTTTTARETSVPRHHGSLIENPPWYPSNITKVWYRTVEGMPSIWLPRGISLSNCRCIFSQFSRSLKRIGNKCGMKHYGELSRGKLHAGFFWRT